MTGEKYMDSMAFLIIISIITLWIPIMALGSAFLTLVLVSVKKIDKWNFKTFISIFLILTFLFGFRNIIYIGDFFSLPKIGEIQEDKLVYMDNTYKYYPSASNYVFISQSDPIGRSNYYIFYGLKDDKTNLAFFSKHSDTDGLFISGDFGKNRAISNAIIERGKKREYLDKAYMSVFDAIQEADSVNSIEGIFEEEYRIYLCYDNYPIATREDYCSLDIMDEILYIKIGEDYFAIDQFGFPEIKSFIDYLEQTMS